MHPRHAFYLTSAIVAAVVAAVAAFLWLPVLWFLIVLLPLFVIGMIDSLQKTDNVLRNYPVWGHWRYLLLSIRPQIQQYFIQSEEEGKPFSAEQRNIVYTRAKDSLGMTPFGTLLDVHQDGYEWVNHSMAPSEPTPESARVIIGGEECKQPYDASIYNCSAMSYGAISPEAIRAINRGAKNENFYHNTGEGGLSKYHLQEGGDICWQIGTGYFGCRAEDGGFDPEKFKTNAAHDQVKMIEIKISQGAKPAHGAILPAAKVSKDIAEARGVPAGQDVDSPPAHKAFSTPIELCQFIQQLRELSNGKPVGFKLCIGNRTEFMSICKAMLKTGITPDFITIDGSEGGTGAAPYEFTNHIGVPLVEGLSFAHSALCGAGLRSKLKLIASGKVITGFDLVSKLSLGADLCNAARGMLFSLGCIQSRRCHTNQCPTGITTQDPNRRVALNINYRANRVASFHRETIASFREVLGATGLHDASELHPGIIYRMINKEDAKSYEQIYEYLDDNTLVNGSAPEHWLASWQQADENKFHMVPLNPKYANNPASQG
jgi:glutamate synthase domain-containing protein 2